MGNVRPKLKPGVVPHVFECQSWRTDTGKTREKERTASKKRTLDSIINAEEPKVESESEMPSQCSASFNTEKPSAKRTKVPVEDDMDGSDEDAGGDGPSESDGNSESDWKESDDAATELDNISCLSRDRIRFLVKKFPMKYLGISEECLFILDILASKLTYTEKSHLTKTDVVMLVLMKIRLNTPFSILCDEFGVTERHCSRLLSRFVPAISACLRETIFMPPRNSVLSNLPLSFRAHSREVNSIIDCFEIEICHPSNAVSQSLTWSQYKNTNTAKYLLSVTPDGMVTFVSKGETGRVSDPDLFRKSGVMDHLPAGSKVMADRGFKGKDPP